MVSGAWISLFWATIPIHVLIGFGILLKQIREPILGPDRLRRAKIGFKRTIKSFKAKAKRNGGFMRPRNLHLSCLRPSWAILGYLGLILGHLGAILRYLRKSWTILGYLWTLFGITGGYLGLVEAILGYLDRILGPRASKTPPGWLSLCAGIVSWAILNHISELKMCIFFG